MQCSLDLAALEESKDHAAGESKIATDEAKTYGQNMSESFGKQLVSYFLRLQECFHRIWSIKCFILAMYICCIYFFSPGFINAGVKWV